MRRAYAVLMLLIGITLFYSCSNNTNTIKQKTIQSSLNKVDQQADGSIKLYVHKAECYSDKINPSSNTAEWNVFVSKSGRFNVWLSSATIDTTNLEYDNKVMLSVQDNRLEAQPGIDKVILNSSDVDLPYFRADSFMGSLYIQDTGHFAIQIISEKILPENSTDDSGSEKTKLLSVFLTPVVR
ncbi:MAG: hypothetical protein IPN68_07370 [Bacteroidetes bacterium]|nr:hypothetical protein [Bacteroidota bacterium]